MERSLSDPKLGEVRAVLERLQTFAADPDGMQPPGAVSNGSGLNGHATESHQPGTYQRLYEPPVREPVESKTSGDFTLDNPYSWLVLLGLVAILGAVLSDWRTLRPKGSL